jgi:Tol biopolymer transport system component
LPSPAAVARTAAPKNGRIVFQRVDPRLGKMRLYTVDADGRGLRPLTTPRGNDDGDSEADWSPDGRRLVFRRFVNRFRTSGSISMSSTRTEPDFGT